MKNKHLGKQHFSSFSKEQSEVAFEKQTNECGAAL